MSTSQCLSPAGCVATWPRLLEPLLPTQVSPSQTREERAHDPGAEPPRYEFKVGYAMIVFVTASLLAHGPSWEG